MQMFKLKYNLYRDENCNLSIRKGEHNEKIAGHGLIFYFLSYNRHLLRLSAVNQPLIIDIAYKDLTKWFIEYGQERDTKTSELG